MGCVWVSPGGGQHGQTPASRSSTRRASLGSPQRGVLQKMSRNGLRCLGCASLSPYIQEDAQISLPGGGAGLGHLLLPLVPSCCNIWGGCGAGETSQGQKHQTLLLHHSGAGRRVLEKCSCWDAGCFPSPVLRAARKRQEVSPLLRGAPRSGSSPLAKEPPAKISPGGSGVNVRRSPPAMRVWGTEQAGQAVPFET